MASSNSLQQPPARRLRVWHFIILPALTMGAALLFSRLVENLVADRLSSSGMIVFNSGRTIVISLTMASLIGWLAVGYRRQYEARLEARNKAIEQTRDFLHSIIEGSGEGIVTLDADDRIISWNSAAARIFGWTADEMLGKSYQRLLPDDAKIIEERRRVTDLIRSGETVRDQQTVRLRKDGTPVILRVTWSPLYDRSGAYAGTTAIVLDISAETEMKQRLLERERLAAVGVMAAQVAHEVRNPLAGIRGALQVILQGKGNERTRHEVGREVLLQVDRLNRTVGELLEFARPASVEPEPTDVRQLIERVVCVLREDPKTRDVVLDCRFATDLPRPKIDPGQMEQVVYNLLINAAQMMEYKGKITVAASAADGQVSIDVRDTGPGISPSVASDIFKPFFSTRSKGTGLGLTIVRKIVHAHRGTITAGSAPAGGAEFRIRLPIDAEDMD
jgi:two-component system sensor histidine kinase HydH